VDDENDSCEWIDPGCVGWSIGEMPEMQCDDRVGHNEKQ